MPTDMAGVRPVEIVGHFNIGVKQMLGRRRAPASKWRRLEISEVGMSIRLPLAVVTPADCSNVGESGGGNKER